MNYTNDSLIKSLSHRFPGARPFLSPSKEGPGDAPETPSHLAPRLKDIERLEQAYERLETQYLRAEENCQLVRQKNKNKDEPDLKEIMKADAYAHRVLMQQIRVLRDLRLAHKNLETSVQELDEGARHPNAPPRFSRNQGRKSTYVPYVTLASLEEPPDPSPPTQRDYQKQFLAERRDEIYALPPKDRKPYVECLKAQHPELWPPEEKNQQQQQHEQQPRAA